MRLAAICDPFSKHSHRRKNKWYWVLGTGRNPAPVDMANIPRNYRLSYIQTVVGLGISEPSAVVGIETPQLGPFSHVSWDVGPSK